MPYSISIESVNEFINNHLPKKLFKNGFTIYSFICH